MIIKIHFSIEEKIKLITAHGYSTTLEKRKFSRPVYHNDTEDYELELYVVKNPEGQEMQLFGYNHTKEEMLDKAFETVLQKNLKSLIFTGKL